MPVMTKTDHLEWAKKRALDYVDAGDTRQAMISFHSDLSKHVELMGEASLNFASLLLLQNGSLDEVRGWIEGSCSRLTRTKADG